MSCLWWWSLTFWGSVSWCLFYLCLVLFLWVCGSVSLFLRFLLARRRGGRCRCRIQRSVVPLRSDGRVGAQGTSGPALHACFRGFWRVRPPRLHAEHHVAEGESGGLQVEVVRRLRRWLRGVVWVAVLTPRHAAVRVVNEGQRLDRHLFRLDEETGVQGRL